MSDPLSVGQLDVSELKVDPLASVELAPAANLPLHGQASVTG
jgi:hypothetical protein